MAPTIREKIATGLYDVAILRSFPHRLAPFPQGWTNSDVPQIRDAPSGSWPSQRRPGEVRFFTHGEKLGDTRYTNTVMQGCLAADQTALVKAVTLTIRGSALKPEDLAKFMGTGLQVCVGTKTCTDISPRWQPLTIEGKDVGVYLTRTLEQDIPIAARQNFWITATIPEAAWEVLDYVELMRVDMDVMLTRDIY